MYDNCGHFEAAYAFNGFRPIYKKNNGVPSVGLLLTTLYALFFRQYLSSLFIYLKITVQNIMILSLMAQLKLVRVTCFTYLSHSEIFP